MSSDTITQPSLIGGNSEPPESEFLANQPPGTEHDESSVRHLILFAKRRWWVIALLALIGVIFGGLENFLSPKRYTAQASIELVEDRSGQFLLQQASGIQDDGSVDSSRLDTVIEILKSNALALETIRKLHLDSNPDFIELKKGPRLNLDLPNDRSQLINIFIGNLNVSRLGHTNIIVIHYTSLNPVLASLIANTLIDSYIEHNFMVNFRSTQQISKWLDAQLGELKGRLQSSQEHMIELQKQIGILGIDESKNGQGQVQSVAMSKLEELNKQLADAQADQLLKEAELHAIQGTSSDVIDSLSAVDPAFQYSREQLVQLRAQYASMIQTYGSAYPPLKELKGQIDQLDRQVASEERTQVSRVRQEFEAASDRVGLLQHSFESEEQKVFDSSSAVVEYELARRNYESNRELYDGLQERLQEAGIIAGLHSSSIHVVDNADVPPRPSEPRKRINLGVGLGGGLFIGLVLAVLLESLDTKLRTIHDIENALRIPVVGAIPKADVDGLLVPAEFNRQISSGVSGPASKIAEALRGLRTSIILSSAGGPPQVIMVTSTAPAEGKTSISALISIVFALNDSKVLIMDGDLRRPSVNLRFKVPNGIGLSSVLSGHAALDEAIRPWPDLSRIHILPSGPVAPLPSELLGSKQMANTLIELRRRYDFIFIDTPPVLAVTDAAVLGRISDATLLVIRFGNVQSHVVSRAMELLIRSGAKLLGAVLNIIDVRDPEYVEYYGPRYSEYYGESATRHANRDS